MANTTINGLTETTTPAASDQFVVWSNSVNATRKVKGENIDKLVFRSRSATTATAGKFLPIISYSGGTPVVENVAYETVSSGGGGGGGGGGGIVGTVAINQGGTGATTASDARTNLGTNDAANITTGTLSNARTTATTERTANSIVQRGANGEINIGNLTSLPNSFNFGEFWSTDLVNYSILGKGNIIVANNGAAGTPLVMFFGGGNVLGSIDRSGVASVAYLTSSDYRLKTNLEPLTGAIARLLQIPVHRFNWIADPDGEKVDGFLAHEAQAVVPECVSGTKDGEKTEEYEVTPAVKDENGEVITPAVMGTRTVPVYQGIDQSKLVPLLVAAVQELSARVAALENR
jgi:hypothetical protein